jgi:hypothetical protein
VAVIPNEDTAMLPVENRPIGAAVVRRCGLASEGRGAEVCASADYEIAPLIAIGRGAGFQGPFGPPPGVPIESI